MLLRNEGIAATGHAPRFSDCGMAAGADDIKDARGAAVADFDNDGDLDIVVNTNPGDCGKDEEGVPPVLLINKVGQDRNWLVIKLAGTSSNADALGAEVRVQAGDLHCMRHVHAGGGYASQSDRRLFFGLGEHDTIDSITVTWPSGREQVFETVQTRQHLFLREGEDLKFGTGVDRRVASNLVEDAP